MDLRIIAFACVAFSALFSPTVSPDADADPPVPITAPVDDGQCDGQSQFEVDDPALCTDRP